ncbi:MAG: UDP-phosphate galactose phosphotransferase, partial [Phototrophicales bacterium]
MFNHPIRAPYVALAAAEMVVLMMSVYLGIKIRLPDTIIDLSSFQDPFYPSAIVYSLTMLISTAALGVYDVRYREGFTSMAIRTVVSYCLLGMTALVVLFYLVPAIKMGRGVLSLSIVISLVNVLALRWVFFETVDRDALRRKVLILGAGKN